MRGPAAGSRAGPGRGGIATILRGAGGIYLKDVKIAKFSDFGVPILPGAAPAAGFFKFIIF